MSVVALCVARRAKKPNREHYAARPGGKRENARGAHSGTPVTSVSRVGGSQRPGGHLASLKCQSAAAAVSSRAAFFSSSRCAECCCQRDAATARYCARNVSDIRLLYALSMSLSDGRVLANDASLFTLLIELGFTRRFVVIV